MLLPTLVNSSKNEGAECVAQMIFSAKKIEQDGDAHDEH